MMHLTAIPFATKTVAISKAGGMLLGMISGMLSFALTEITTGQAALAILASAVSSAVVAYFSYRPKVIVAQSQAKMNESEFLSRRMSEHIARLEKTSSENLQIIRLQVEARHDIAGLLTPLQHNYDYICLMAKEAGLTLPDDLPDISAQIRNRVQQLDKDIRAVVENAKGHA